MSALNELAFERYPYCTFPDGTEVIHTSIQNGRTVARAEVPDSRYGFRVFEVEIPTFNVTTIEHMDDRECEYWMRFFKNNGEDLLEYSAVGGIANA